MREIILIDFQINFTVFTMMDTMQISGRTVLSIVLFERVTFTTFWVQFFFKYELTRIFKKYYCLTVDISSMKTIL